ncbi:ATP-dependent endonuclease [Blastopirellula retiformator]|uniref:ATP-dependent endonuclease n=1 Tax=Blastopirellula retiformator TaxID=2527970 RepID=UPI0016482E32|nr:ATP-dependent endonuclease [Blastopirellula retiformator]
MEGVNDIEFLRRISPILHQSDPSLPNLAELEALGKLIFIPFGGGHVRAWSDRLAPLNLPEFHLYDHELPPETEYRQEAADCVNQREHCSAVLTRKRSLENYLHPQAIEIAGGFPISFDDFDCVADLAAKCLYQQGVIDKPWELQSLRARSRMANRAKRWLNTVAVGHMTPELLRERDANGELIGWFRTMSSMIDEPQPTQTEETE